MKKLVLGLIMIIFGLVGIWGIANGFTQSTKVSIFKEIFSISKIDGLRLYAYLLVSIAGVIMSFLSAVYLFRNAARQRTN